MIIHKYILTPNQVESYFNIKVKNPVTVTLDDNELPTWQNQLRNEDNLFSNKTGIHWIDGAEYNVNIEDLITFIEGVIKDNLK